MNIETEETREEQKIGEMELSRVTEQRSLKILFYTLKLKVFISLRQNPFI